MNNNPGIIYQVAPVSGNCVNQHININQNFFLSPHFVLFLKEQQENPLAAGTEALSAAFANQNNPALGQRINAPSMPNQFPATTTETHMMPQTGLLNMH